VSEFSGDAPVTTPRVAGWLAFAGALLVVSGAFKILDALFLPWIYYQPLWTILSVALAVLVVFALATYGGPRLPETPARV
jgi:hypothetical protein